MQGNTKIRANFEKVHRESTADNAIDWGQFFAGFVIRETDHFLVADFWGRVMSNYEEVASTQRQSIRYLFCGV